MLVCVTEIKAKHLFQIVKTFGFVHKVSVCGISERIIQLWLNQGSPHFRLSLQKLSREILKECSRAFQTKINTSRKRSEGLVSILYASAKHKKNWVQKVLKTPAENPAISSLPCFSLFTDTSCQQVHVFGKKGLYIQKSDHN